MTDLEPIDPEKESAMPDELDALFRLRPAFRRLAERFGGLSVAEYERAAVFSIPPEPVRSAFAALSGADAPLSDPVVATGMHTGLLAGASPLMSLLYGAAASGGCGGLSLSNSSITLNNAHGPELLCLPTAAGMLEFHLFPKRQRKQPLASLPAVDLGTVRESMVRETKRLLGAGAVDPLLEDALGLVEAFWPTELSRPTDAFRPAEAFRSPEAFRSTEAFLSTEPPSFLTEQIGAFNRAVASALLGPGASAGSWVAQEAFLARYFAAPAEELATPLTELLFDPAGYAELARVLEGTAGFSNDPGSTRTAFFWHLSEGAHARRTPTRVLDGLLVAGEERHELTRDSLARLLARRRIMPSKVMKFLLVHFAWGFPVAGGHNQLEYLTELGDALGSAGLIVGRPDQLFRPTRAFPLPGLDGPGDAGLVGAGVGGAGAGVSGLGSPFELLVRGDPVARTSAFIDAVGRMPLAELLRAYAPYAVEAIGGGETSTPAER